MRDREQWSPSGRRLPARGRLAGGVSPGGGGTARGGRTIALVVTAASTLVVGAATASPAGAAPAPVPEVQLVVKLADHVADHPGDVLDGLPGSLPRSAVANRWSLEVPAGEVALTLARLRADKRVVYASESHRVHAADVPNDVCYVSTCGAPGTSVISGDTGVAQTATQGDLSQVGAPAAWSLTHGSSRILVAVLDTGVESTHTDLVGQVTAGPVLCAGDDPLCVGVRGPDTDDNGHGTHVTGTVAAHTNDGVGVASLGWLTRAETFKVLDSHGDGSTADLATGIYDAVAAGASVINMSLGNSGCSIDPSNCGPDPDTMAAVAFAQAHNVVVVAAAGNGNDTLTGGSNEPTYPASYPGVLAVAAVDQNNDTTSYSEYGAAANIAAPGNKILSTWNSPNDDTYATLTGTSMASPHVAAAAALVFAVNPRLSGSQVVSMLESTATPVGGRAINGGLLDVPAALAAAVQQPTLPAYQLAGSDGSIYPFGAARFFGDLRGLPLAAPIVAVNARKDRSGYWEAASDGGVFAFGSAGFFGSTGGMRLNRPVVGMAATPSGNGYWLVASDGGIFSFGDAGFFGSTGALRLNKPVVGMATTLTGGGYWLVASDGGIFSFGVAGFYGSAGNLRLNAPVVAMMASPDAGGYLLAANDGGLFTFGDAPFEGSTGGEALPAPVVGISG